MSRGKDRAPEPVPKQLILANCEADRKPNVTTADISGPNDDSFYCPISGYVQMSEGSVKGTVNCAGNGKKCHFNSRAR